MINANLTEEKVRNSFGLKTFSKGLEYFEEGRVSSGVKVEDMLYAKVWGTAPEPYEVKVILKPSGIFSECTCPVGGMCKHGVASLLKWIHEPSSFINGDELLLSLKRKSKEELIALMEIMMKEQPLLISKILFPVEESEYKVKLDAIADQIEWIVNGDLDYYHIWDAIHRLEDIKKTADKLVEKGAFKEAAEIYLMYRRV